MSRLAVGLVLVAACRVPGSPIVPMEQGSALRRAFNEAKDRPRLIVALSPT